jgi:hypothetical protein
MSASDCGGCRGIGSHRRFCPRHPEYHPWRQLAQMAEDIGDRIGANDTGISNRAYYLSSAIRQAILAHPYRSHVRPTDVTEELA